MGFIFGALAALFCTYLIRLWHRRKSRASLSIGKFARLTPQVGLANPADLALTVKSGKVVVERRYE